MASHGRRSAGITDEPGPIDEDDVACARCPIGEGNGAVYRLPDPGYGVATVSALCSYHLAAIKREYEERWAKFKQHPKIERLEALTAEHALVELRDVAEEIEVNGETYQRVGLDDTGSAYFVRDYERYYRVIETNEHYDVLNSVRVAPEGGLARTFDHVEDRVGWRVLESEWAERARSEEGGDAT